jgi:hypothetical protein
MRLRRIVSLPVEVGAALVMSAAAAYWWFSIPKAERDELKFEIAKFVEL